VKSSDRRQQLISPNKIRPVKDVAKKEPMNMLLSGGAVEGLVRFDGKGVTLDSPSSSNLKALIGFNIINRNEMGLIL
jgi:hypothetical protein